MRELPRAPNYPLIYPKCLLLRAIRAPLKGHWGVLVRVKAQALVFEGLWFKPSESLV